MLPNPESLCVSLLLWKRELCGAPQALPSSLSRLCPARCADALSPFLAGPLLLCRASRCLLRRWSWRGLEGWWGCRGSVVEHLGRVGTAGLLGEVCLGAGKGHGARGYWSSSWKVFKSWSCFLIVGFKGGGEGAALELASPLVALKSRFWGKTLAIAVPMRGAGRGQQLLWQEAMPAAV